MSGYDNMILNTDVCPDCGVRYWFGDPCECPEEEAEESEEE